MNRGGPFGRVTRAICSILSDTLEAANLFGYRPSGRQPLDRARAMEAVDPSAVRNDVVRAGRLRDRPAVTDDEHFRVHAAGRVGDALDALDAVLQRLRALRADRT